MGIELINATFPEKGNYLSRLSRQKENRRWDRRKCNFMVRIMYTKDGLKNISVLRAAVQDISEGGALAIMPYDEVPKFFYMIIGKYQLQIGCSVVSHKKPIVRIEFLQDQDSALIDFLASTARATDTLNFMKRLNIYI